MSALLELAERCEQATGPDRELDKAVWAALGNCNHERTEYYCIEDGNDCDSGFTCLDCRADTYGAKAAPTFTASLDAALTLVPEGWRSRESLWQSGQPAWSVHLSHDDSPRNEISSGYSATEPLALCAAALRARLSPTEANDRKGLDDVTE